VIAVHNERVARAQLTNGHVLLAYVTRAARGRIGALGAGDRLMIEVSPFDLSKGRVLARK
jgi:translation initiation factor IF-1